MSLTGNIKGGVIAYLNCIVALYTTTFIMSTLRIEYTQDNFTKTYIVLVSGSTILSLIVLIMKYFMFRDKGGETDV